MNVRNVRTHANQVNERLILNVSNVSMHGVH